MYHRFNETKYPSTNINMDIFKKQIEIIKNNKIEFYDPKDFDNNFDAPKLQKMILLTIDDGYISFYKHAWPFLKKNKIPFLLFISTKQVGNKGYMNWEQINEVSKEDFAYIGNHSYSHDYLVDFKFEEFKIDINKAITNFKKNLGFNPIFFSYPFGEFSLKQKNFIKKNFKYAFGQHSGVIDINKDKFELPRFPINEKYGDLERFEFIIQLFPIPFKNLKPKDKFVSKKQNPPVIEIDFFDEQKNIKNINCYSNDGGDWKKSDLKFNGSTMTIIFKQPFIPRRGRINCSLNDNGKWRWFGTQFIISKN